MIVVANKNKISKVGEPEDGMEGLFQNLGYPFELVCKQVRFAESL